MTDHNRDSLMTRVGAAKYLGVKATTLAAWSSTGRYGLRFVKVGRCVRYLKSDLDSFLSERTKSCHTGSKRGGKNAKKKAKAASQPKRGNPAWQKGGPSPNPSGRPIGAVGGRKKAVAAIDSIMGNANNRKKIEGLLQIEFDDDPCKFYKKYAEPLILALN